MQIDAALGVSGRAPLLARDDGVAVVVGRPPVPGQASVSSAFVLPCVGVVQVEGATRGLYPLHPGSDLAQLLEVHPQGLPVEWAAAIAVDVSEGLRALDAVGLSAVIREDAVRVGTDGVTRLVEIRPGLLADGLQSLADLLERCVEEPHGPALAKAIVEANLDSLVSERRAAADAVIRFPTERTLGKSEAAAAPPKLVVARIGVLMLALGLSMGWMLAPRTAHTPLVEVPGSTALQLSCGPTHCEITAIFADGSASGRVDANSDQLYTCTRNARTLECSASSP